jgi:hypothetical protein
VKLAVIVGVSIHVRLGVGEVHERGLNAEFFPSLNAKLLPRAPDVVAGANFWVGSVWSSAVAPEASWADARCKTPGPSRQRGQILYVPARLMTMN